MFFPLFRSYKHKVLCTHAYICGHIHNTYTQKEDTRYCDDMNLYTFLYEDVN